jgi:XTP/dITP diphosphohydrolase
MIERLVIATHNRKKAGEMVTILQTRFPGLQIQTLADYPSAGEPEETGTTYIANAIIKAEAAAEATGEWCVADDAGLEIDAMDRAPGLYSKRFAGEDTPFSEKIRIILENLNGREDRAARFRCAVAFAKTGEPTVSFEAICEGVIAQAPSGNGGFGYDPIFWLPELGCTMADLTAEQKHAVSHRGKVLKAFSDYLSP